MSTIERLQRLTLLGDEAAARDLLAAAKRAGDPLRALIAQATLRRASWDDALPTLIALPPDALDDATLAHLDLRLPSTRPFSGEPLLQATAEGRLTAALRLVTVISLSPSRLDSEAAWQTLLRAPLDRIDRVWAFAPSRWLSPAHFDPARTPWVARLQDVTLYQHLSGGRAGFDLDALVWSWARAPEMRLRVLHLCRGDLSGDALTALLSAPWAARLRALRLEDLGLPSLALASPVWGRLPALRSLWLRQQQPAASSADLVALTRALPCDDLDDLILPASGTLEAAEAWLRDPAPGAPRRALWLLGSALYPLSPRRQREATAAEAQAIARLGSALLPQLVACARALRPKRAAALARGFGRALAYLVAAVGPQGAPGVGDALAEAIPLYARAGSVSAEVISACAVRLLSPPDAVALVARLLCDPATRSIAWGVAVALQRAVPGALPTQALLRAALALLGLPGERTHRRVLRDLSPSQAAALNPWLWRGLSALEARASADEVPDLPALPDLPDLAWPAPEVADGLFRALWASLPAGAALRVTLARVAVTAPFARLLTLTEALLSSPDLLADTLRAAPTPQRVRLLELMRRNTYRRDGTWQPAILSAALRADPSLRALLPPLAVGWPEPQTRAARATTHALMTLNAHALASADPDAARALSRDLAARPDALSQSLAVQLSDRLDNPSGGGQGDDQR